MSKFGRLRRRKATDDLRGRIPESYHCIDCGFDTAPGWLGRAEMEQAFAKQASVEQTIDARFEVYAVHDHVWKAAAMEPWGGCLCVDCLERRLGRRLTPDDFPANHVFNNVPATPRLLERQGRYDPLGDFVPEQTNKPSEGG